MDSAARRTPMDGGDPRITALEARLRAMEEAVDFLEATVRDLSAATLPMSSWSRLYDTQNNALEAIIERVSRDEPSDPTPSVGTTRANVLAAIVGSRSRRS